MAMIAGGIIIMPIDMVTVATTMSITRNGRMMRNPISKARRSSEIMNAGTLLAKDGLYAEAIEKMRSALEKMPRNVRLLLNAAHIMITYMESSGAQPDIVREARQNLLAANQLSPGEARFATLMTKLEGMDRA